MATTVSKKTKVTMLSGFLGAGRFHLHVYKQGHARLLRVDCCLIFFFSSGKTTLLRHVLENSKEKVACIVNDVASVNIDVRFMFKILNTGILSSSLKGTLELLSFLRLSGRSNLPPFPCMHYDVTVWLCMHANTAANTSFCAISQAKLVRNDRNRARGDQVNTTADLAGEGRRAGSGTMNSDTLFSW